MQRQRNVVGQERHPVARRHANALAAKAAQIRVVPRRRGRNFAAWPADALEAILSHDTANHPSHQQHAACMFRAPQWHGAAQTHFPPRPRKSQWRCDITNVISPHGLPTQWKQTYHTIPPIIPLASDTPRLHQRVSRFPVARRHACQSAWHCDIRDVISPHGLPTH